MKRTPQSASGRLGGCRIAPLMAEWPRGSYMRALRMPSKCVHEVPAAVEHGVTGDGADAADDDPGGHSLGVRVDGVEDPACAHQVQPWASAFSVASRTSASCSGVRATRGGRHGPP